MCVKIGLVGTGYWGNRIRSKLARLSTPNELIFFSKDPSEYFSSMKLVDWVIVASPDETHFEIVSYALSQGVNVFCEKPLTLSDFESTDLYRSADKNGLRLYVDDVFFYHHVPLDLQHENQVRWIKETHCFSQDPIDLLNKLAYHDIYLLYPNLKDMCPISVTVEAEESQLGGLKFRVLHERGVVVDFEYSDRGGEGLEHSINGATIGSNSDADPLTIMLDLVISDKADFVRNRETTIWTGRYIDYIRARL